MKAKHLAAAMVLVLAFIVLALAFNGGAAAAPKKAVKPIPEAFHGYWVGGHIGKKPLTEEQMAVSCPTLMPAPSGEVTEEPMLNALKGLDYDSFREKNMKFSVVAMKIDGDKMEAFSVEDSSMEISNWSENPVQYSKYSPSHIQGVMSILYNVLGDDEPTKEREKFNYHIDDEGNLRLNNKPYFKNVVLKPCDN